MLYIYVLAAFGATFLGFIISVYIFTGKSKKNEEPIEEYRRQRNENDEKSHIYEAEKDLERIPTAIDSNASFNDANTLECNDVLSFTDIYSAVTNQNMYNTVQGQHLKEQGSYKLINRKIKNKE